MTTKTLDAKTKPKARPGDRIFFGLSLGSGFLIMVTLAAVGLFLLAEGFPGLLLKEGDISTLDSPPNFIVYIWPLVYGTVLAAIVALGLAVPVSVGVALFISHYAPRKLGSVIGYVIDLLAAVPSVVYGAWGLAVLGPGLVPFYIWLSENLGFLPLFETPVSTTGRTIFTVCIVLALMILPIITAICREIFLQTPRLHEEAAMALGATRWEVIRLAVFPYARSGVVSAAMLGLGRALGETMAVAMVLSATGVVTINLIGPVNPTTIAANVALKFPEAYGIQVNILIASGLVLFAITFAVNYLARLLVNRQPKSAE